MRELFVLSESYSKSVARTRKTFFMPLTQTDPGEEEEQLLQTSPYHSVVVLDAQTITTRQQELTTEFREEEVEKSTFQAPGEFFSLSCEKEERGKSRIKTCQRISAGTAYSIHRK